ncbi:MAG TPA: hypothetical protein VHU41_19735, partial [Thermoanaerobaculia bacterium]|nr:hypothetical protein [Thermoanaerobaculia bacterium]
MARASKGDRLPFPVRLPAEIKKALEQLAHDHDVAQNDEAVEAIVKHVRGHDPATCVNVWCVTRRTKRNG